jgi:hypothetical protein
MFLRKNKAIFFVMVLMSANSYATWTLVDTDKKSQYFVDTDYALKEGKTIKVPAYINNITNKVNNLSEGLMMEFDCKGKRLRIVFFSTYKKFDLKGEAEDSMRLEDSKWMPSGNKGLGAMFNKACKS